MDTKLFRLPTEPSLYGSIPTRVAEQATMSRLTPKDVYAAGPAPDSRFPGWAGPMEDGRLVTDYRTHCSENIPAGQQFAVHQWMQRNAESILEISRTRQAKQAGALQPFDSTVVPPPQSIVHCNPAGCAVQFTHLPSGFGQERQEIVPELFGTFAYQKTEERQPLPPITRTSEGGRNSLRGRAYSNLGTQGIGSVNLRGTYLRAA
jgi:hypothetical protein